MLYDHKEITILLLDLNSYPVKPVLPILLQDKTTKSNIIFATDAYEELGDQFSVTAQITETVLTNERFCLLPRVEKERTDQAERTRNKAEVFTPGFIIQRIFIQSITGVILDCGRLRCLEKKLNLGNSSCNIIGSVAKD